MTNSAQAEPAVQEVLASFQGRLADLRAQVDAAKAALSDVTATARSTDGTVQVTVDSSGALTGIEFGPLDGITPEWLAAQVLNAVHKARVAALDNARDSVMNHVGPDNPAVAVLAARAEALKEQRVTPPETVLVPTGAATTSLEAEEIGYVGRGR